MIVITGASDGLGLQLAKLYKKSGKKVVNISRRECEYADVNICLSLREGPQLREIADRILELDDQLEALVHNAGVESFEDIGEITEDEIKRLMSTNVKPQILLTSFLIERLKKDQTDVVCVSSTSGTKAVPGHIVYNTSKWAVRGFAVNLREVFKNLPNRVISFVPGGFESQIGVKALGRPKEMKTGSMRAEDVALFMKQILDLPKNMEVSEVIINRKATK